MLAQGTCFQWLPGQPRLVAGQLEGGGADPGTRLSSHGRSQGLPGGAGQGAAAEPVLPGSAIPAGDQGLPGQGQETLPGVAGVQPGGAPLKQPLGAGRPGCGKREGVAVPGGEVHGT